MSCFCFSPIFLLCLIVLALPAPAQTAKQPVPASNAAGKDKSEAKAEADRVAKQPRAQARSVPSSRASGNGLIQSARCICQQRACHH
ncbi:hypothetical protein BH20ACI3_BH20ACI3_14480 [soil metagenome]